MSSVPPPDAAAAAPSRDLWATLRRLAWPLLRTYGITVTAGGFALLAGVTFLVPPQIDFPLFVFLTLLSAFTRLLGFPAGGLTNSLFGVVDLTTILLLGPIAGAWQSALAVLISSAVNVVRGQARTTWSAVRLPLFNAALKIFMALISGELYLLAGGRIPSNTLGPELLLPALVLVSAWFIIDYGGWSLFELFAGGRTRFFQWTRYTVTTAILVEYVPLPLAFLASAVYVNIGGDGLAMFGAALLLSSTAIRLVATSRGRLEARVEELSTLNRVSEEIIRASHSEQDICDLIYRFASQVVDTTYFLLGLIDSEGKTERLAVLVAEGERQQSQTLSVGGVVTWLEDHRQPLIVRDLHHEALPFAPRQLGARGGLVRSALFVPMLAGQELIGFMSIQSQLPNSFSADDSRILAAMANQAAMAIANIRLQRQAEERQRLERELHIASDIQRSLLPAACPVVPGFEMCTDWSSAREVSGDFYDFLTLQHNMVGIIIADVSDKGVPAALFMALSRSLVRSGLLGSDFPAEGLRKANRWIVKDSNSDMFLTLFYGVLDPRNHTLTYVNAGHNPPIVFYKDQRAYQYLDRHGIALGVVEEARYEEFSVRLSAGDVVLFYTDGVIDALNAQGEVFGEAHLRQVAGRVCHLPAADMIQHIKDEMAAHVGDQPAFDDATLIVVRCTA